MGVAANANRESTMSEHHTPTSLRLASAVLCTRLGAAGLLAAALTACGGGGDAGPAPAQAKALALPDSAAVLFKGCVVDESFLPHEGVPVRVLAADGRLLGNARSGRSGEFQLRLPAGTRVALQVDADGGESMTVQIQDQDQRFATCLQARTG
jgi:hypothetical protein